MNSGLTFHADATAGESRRLGVSVTIDGPFTENILECRFPRWIPGSYLIREPMQHLTDLSCTADDVDIKVERFGVDGIRVRGISSANKLVLTYRVLAAEMTCRANHLDATHLHLMPPYTWVLPTRGIEASRLDLTHTITLEHPDDWTTATQHPGEEGRWTANGRDELLDGIMESNANEMISWDVMGTTQHLKLWDSGGFKTPQKSIDRFIETATPIIEEHFGLFGVPDWKEYWTVLHLTDSGRGGLEHLRSQTSMMPRKCMQEGNEEEWRDLVSLFSHEFLHQWNVKQLRPQNFLDYDLQKEVHTDLLWWFEGLTSWLGDIICLRSGAWSNSDWNKDWMRKMNRHFDRNGMEHESLTESSHDSWIHLYRPNSYSREVQISYYLEGEMAIFCLDVELRKRSKGASGLDNVMATLYHDFRLGSKKEGVKYADIRKALVNTSGGRNLGKMLDSLVSERKAPDVLAAFATLGMELVREKERKGAWLGLKMSNSQGRTKVRTHLTGSPCREMVHTGDEIIAIDGLRVTSCKEIGAAVHGSANTPVILTLTREGVLHEVEVTPVPHPEHTVKVKGEGNRIWKAIKCSTRRRELLL